MQKKLFYLLFNSLLIAAIGYAATDDSYLVPDGSYGNSGGNHTYELGGEYDNTSGIRGRNTSAHGVSQYGASRLSPNKGYMHREDRLKQSR